MLHRMSLPGTGRGARRLGALAAAGVVLSLAGAVPAAASVSPVYTLIDLSAAQASATGAGVTVGVVDSGTVAIPELAGQLTQGPDYVGGAAGDEDHGTWMADVVHQMAPQAHILSVRVVSDVHGSVANMDDSCTIASGIAYAAEHGAKVINLSLGISDATASGYTSCQAKAVEQALADGITVVASAGNDGGAVDPAEPAGDNGGNAESFPAAFTGVIGVAAVTPSGTRASFSNVHSYVDVAAPGTDVPAIGQDDTTDEVDGTSPAGAVVSGVAALILSKVPGLAPWQVAEALESTASHPSSWDPQTGYGEINAAAALAAAEKMTPASPTVSMVPYHGAGYFSASGSGFSAGGSALTAPGAVAGALGAALLAAGLVVLVRRRAAAGTPAAPTVMAAAGGFPGGGFAGTPGSFGVQRPGGQAPPPAAPPGTQWQQAPPAAPQWRQAPQPAPQWQQPQQPQWQQQPQAPEPVPQWQQPPQWQQAPAPQQPGPQQPPQQGAQWQQQPPGQQLSPWGQVSAGQQDPPAQSPWGQPPQRGPQQGPPADQAG
jgi:hypothetical protein